MKAALLLIGILQALRGELVVGNEEGWRWSG
jgi:hypothetical protein